MEHHQILISHRRMFITITIKLTILAIILIAFEVLFYCEENSLFFSTRIQWINCLTGIFFSLRNANSFNLSRQFISISQSKPITFQIIWLINAISNWVIIFSGIFSSAFYRKNSSKEYIYILTAFFSTFAHCTLHQAVVLIANEIGGMYESMRIFHYMTYSMNLIVFSSIYQFCDTDNILQRALISILLCKFLDILELKLVSHVSRIVLGSLVVVDTITKFQNFNIISQVFQSFLLIIVVIIASVFILKSMLVIYVTSRGYLTELRRTRIQADQSEQQYLTGLTANDLLQLKKINIELMQENEGDLEIYSCSICCSDIQESTFIYLLRCNHLFHTDCLDAWLQTRNTCPNCRQVALIKQNNAIFVDQNHRIES